MIRISVVGAIALLGILPAFSRGGDAYAGGAPLDVYGRLPTLEDVALSPDGTMLAFIKTVGEDRLIAIVGLADLKVASVLRLGEAKVRSLEWADEDNLLITASSTNYVWGLLGMRREWFTMSSYNVRTGKLHGLLREELSRARTMNVIYGTPMIRRVDGDTILFVHGLYVNTRTNAALFRINLTKGTEQLLRQGTDATRAWLVDDAGTVVAEEDYRNSDRRWSIRTRRDGRLQEAVSGTEAIDVPDVLGFAPNGDDIVVELIENGAPVWRKLSLRSGDWGEPLSDGAALRSPIGDPATNRMIGGRRNNDRAEYVFFDVLLDTRWSWIKRQFSGERVEYLSMTKDHAKILVRATGNAHGYAYYLCDMQTHTVVKVGDIYDGLSAIAEVRSLSYKAADGLEIPAYLTLPPGRPAKALPLVVLPHGGPAARDAPGFGWWSQALAAQGYAVLQPNFRGSSIDWQWTTRGFGEWGRKMQSDLSDGVRRLAADGIVDPARVCIVGASYGGYAALAGAALEQGTYRCAVAVAGMSDPRRFLEWVDQRDHGEWIAERYLRRFLGVTDNKDPVLDAISPLKHATAVASPLLLIHGKDDTVVPYEQSRDMVEALQRAGKPVEFVALDKEDHWLSRSATRLKMLSVSVDFLKTHNPPD